MRTIPFLKHAILPLFTLISSCSPQGGSTSNADTSDSLLSMQDTTTAIAKDKASKNRTDIVYENDFFEGEYAVGDGSWFISPAHMSFEMRNDPSVETASYILYFKGFKNDTISSYATEDESITFDMYPGHEKGWYYELDEDWPVQRVALLKTEETEEEISERLQKEALENVEDFSIYQGKYELVTESEGATGTLILRHAGGKQFSFELTLQVYGLCSGSVKGNFKLNPANEADYSDEECPLFFSFKGSYADYGLIVEVDQPGICTFLSEDCIFSGTYSKKDER